MKTWFYKRGYPSGIVENETKKVKFSNNSFSKKNKNNEKGVAFVLTYHPLFKSLGYIMNKNLKILYMDPEAKRVFSPKPMITFKSARKLSSYIVRAKLYPLERFVGSKKCNGNRCDVCLNVNETDTFTRTVTNLSYKINHQFNCSEKCLVYLLTCKTCSIQYVGQTTNCFRFRWNNYKCNERKFQGKEPCMQEHLFKHFSLPNHNGFLEDADITFIDKTDPSNPLKRENFWIETLRTMVPNDNNSLRPIKKTRLHHFIPFLKTNLHRKNQKTSVKGCWEKAFRTVEDRGNSILYRLKPGWVIVLEFHFSIFRIFDYIFCNFLVFLL